jgi:gliding motility-associated-like protein
MVHIYGAMAQRYSGVFDTRESYCYSEASTLYDLLSKSVFPFGYRFYTLKKDSGYQLIIQKDDEPLQNMDARIGIEYYNDIPDKVHRPPYYIKPYSVSEDFAFNQSITIEATGTGGIYEYQLDNGPYQDSPVFDNVESGFHTITVRDKNNCGLTITEAIVINYPKFFTPNGDGDNDTWNIKDLRKQSISNIMIFDRYGKFITDIKPSGNGWNGTYNGTQAISDDYWFIVTYKKDNESKEFKAHFTLKR